MQMYNKYHVLVIHEVIFISYIYIRIPVLSRSTQVVAVYPRPTQAQAISGMSVWVRNDSGTGLPASVVG